MNAIFQLEGKHFAVQDALCTKRPVEIDIDKIQELIDINLYMEDCRCFPNFEIVKSHINLVTLADSMFECQTN